VIAGGSLMWDGISSFDDQHGVFYYSPDWPAPLIYSASVVTSSVLAPIYIPGQMGIDRLEYDPAYGQLLVLMTVQKGKLDEAYLVSLPVASPGGFKTVGVFQSGVVVYSTDAYQNNFYALVKAPTALFSLLTVNLSNPAKPISNVPVTCDNTTLPIKLVYDAVLNHFWAYAEVWKGSQLSYAVWSFTANGNCTLSPINIPSGITTSYSYDAADHILWLGHTTNGGNYVISYAVQTQIVKPIPTTYVPEALEFAYKN